MSVALPHDSPQVTDKLAIPSTCADASDPIFVMCPANRVTGGPEVLHQLVDLLRSHGRQASIIYTPFDNSHSVPEPYRVYDIEVATISEITERSLVVVPETHAWKLARLPKCRIFFWWLSVDNFLAGAAPNLEGRPLVRKFLQRAAKWLVRRRAAAHLFQSEYARHYAESLGMAPLLSLSDYLSPAFMTAAQSAPTTDRDDLLVFNPAKGFDRTELVLQALKSRSSKAIEVLPIQNMDRSEVTQALSRAKVYIDFGDHPGKDRLPREAAALGCCVLVNRRGSAANPSDVPIPDSYKIDDFESNFAAHAADMIIRICEEFAQCARDFDSYRARIASERQMFAADALHIFNISALSRPDAEIAIAGD